MNRTAAQIVGSKIRRRRNDLGVSQERFASMVGTSRRNIMRWEGGHHMPSFAKLAAVAQALACDVSELLPSRSDVDDDEDADLPTAAEHELIEALRPLARLLARAQV